MRGGHVDAARALQVVGVDLQGRARDLAAVEVGLDGETSHVEALDHEGDALVGAGDVLDAHRLGSGDEAERLHTGERACRVCPGRVVVVCDTVLNDEVYEVAGAAVVVHGVVLTARLSNGLQHRGILLAAVHIEEAKGDSNAEGSRRC